METQEAKPAFVPMKCVVCNGFGTLRYGEKVCQACDGKGYILVPALKKDGNNGKPDLD